MCTNNSIFNFPAPSFDCGGVIKPKKTAYSVDYFLKFFDSIPEDKWIVGKWHNEDKTKFCAMGHLGSDSEKGTSQEAFDLGNILGCNPAAINDGKNRFYKEDHPKHRIMTALIDAKKYGKAMSDPSVEGKGYKIELESPIAYKANYFNEMYGSWNYEKITLEELPKIEIKEVVKEVIKEVVVEKVVEKIVYVTVDQEVRQLQEETLTEN